MDFSNKTTELLKKYEIDFESRLIKINQYEDDCLLLKPRNDILLEAKRLILNTQLEKIINVNLSDSFNNKISKPCKQNINFASDAFKNIPPPNTKLEINPLEITYYHKEITAENDLILDQIKIISEQQIQRINRKSMLRKYFIAWKKVIDRKKLKLEIVKYEILQKEKLEQFFKQLKRKKMNTKNLEKTKQHTIKSSMEEDDGNATTCESISISDDNSVKSKSKNSAYLKKVTKNLKTQPTFVENRFKAQTEIIVMQKAKLLEQERLIEDLKLGKIREDLNKSVEESKNSIREIFSKCTLKTRIKMPIILEDKDDKFHVNSNKAPKVARAMEERAKERALNRQIIQERKRILDIERKRIVEEIVENKRIQDEDEKIKNLEAIKERRRKELELDRLRLRNKQKFLDDCKKADAFRIQKLKIFGLNGFKKLIQRKMSNELLSEVFYEEILKIKYLNKWRLFYQQIIDEKNAKADYFYNQKLMKKCFNIFFENHLNSRRNYQVAVDYHDMQLQCKVLKNLHLFVCKEQMKRYVLYKKAANHYNNRILVQYFYQWKSLKAVIQLEIAKEQKKRKWREKVMQILPDYKPPVDEYGYL